MSSEYDAYNILCDHLLSRGVDVDEVKERLKSQKIETPSWGYGDSGTRFKVFPWPGAPRNVYEKLDDAAFIHRLCGVAPSVAIHIPWDQTDDWAGLKQYAEDQGLRIGAVNPNVFQREEYKLGSVCNPSTEIRKRAISDMIDSCRIMEETGSDILSIWLADGTNYPGQDDFSQRKHRLEESLAVVYKQLPENSRMLVEYKFFEPAFCHTDLADWGMAYTLCLKLGPQAQVLVDTGHHPQGTNVAHIVAFLLDEGRLGGFHLNARQYADDDLIVGSINSWEIFTIYHELINAGAAADQVAYMIDQSHNIESKLEAMLMSVLNCQQAFAKALLVDGVALKQAQLGGDVLGAHALLKDAFETDVRPLLRQVRIEMDVPEDPLSAFRDDPYQMRVARERGSASESGGGYPGG